MGTPDGLVVIGDGGRFVLSARDCPCVDQLGVSAARQHEIGVAVTLDDLPSDMSMTSSASIKVVRRCAIRVVRPRAKFGQCRLDLTLGVIVQRAGRPIEDEDPRIAQMVRAMAIPLTLAAGEPVPLELTSVSNPSGGRHDASTCAARRDAQISVVRIGLGQ